MFGGIALHLQLEQHQIDCQSLLLCNIYLLLTSHWHHNYLFFYNKIVVLCVFLWHTFNSLLGIVRLFQTSVIWVSRLYDIYDCFSLLFIQLNVIMSRFWLKQTEIYNRSRLWFCFSSSGYHIAEHYSSCFKNLLFIDKTFLQSTKWKKPNHLKLKLIRIIYLLSY